jgi:DNA-binding MarR family transcriptional regulator
MVERRTTQRDDDASAHDPAGPPASRGASKRRTAARTFDLGMLNGHLGYFLRRAQVAVFQDFIRSLSSVDIRPAQYSVLVVIGANPGLSQTDVSEMLGIERARLVRLLDRLEKRGLMQRLASSVDRRTHSLRLTTAGRTLLKKARTLAALHEAKLLERLGAQRHKMVMDALRDFGAAR